VSPRATRSGRGTPLLEQYRALKRQHPDAILFYRLGDFYEMFFEDAELASRLLGLTLTTRNRNDPDPVPLAGVPWHQRDTYVARLLRRGYRVAICEQLQDAAQAKGIVERGVTEVLTPGSLLGESFLEAGVSAHLAALWPAPGAAPGEPLVGFALADASTGELRAGAAPPEAAAAELSRVRIAEWLVPQEGALPPLLAALVAGGGAVTRLPLEDFPGEAGWLERRFAAGALPAELAAGRHARAALAGAVLYLDRVQGGRASQLRPPQWIAPGDALVLGPEARAGLELFEGSLGDGKHTLWAVVDRTVTGAGARRLRRWLERPLLEVAAIERRLEAVARLREQAGEREALRAALGDTYDLERLVARLAAERATPRDLAALRETLHRVPAVREALGEAAGEAPGDAAAEAPAGAADTELARLAEALDPHPALADLLARALVDDPPSVWTEGGVVRPGHDAECDRLRAAARSGKEWMAALEASERQRTGIPSLKISYNRIFGYSLEVTRPHLAKVPADYERRQTLAAAERFVTPELKRMEGEILGAEQKLVRAEAECFLALRREALAWEAGLRRLGDALSALDALAALAEVAAREGWSRPRLTGGDRLLLRGARHPVVEANLGPGRFVPNDLDLDGTARQILLLTGPNMGGKSTYLRAAGLLVVLAQAGSFVPARQAEIGLVDRIFTRVGAADALAAGRSTFMVEMVEVAEILRRATPRSLVLLDEVGRGTSTYDGLALAWALTEELHRETGPRPRTLFATHYHELTRLARELPRLRNLHVRVREAGDEVVFLHEVAEGPADRSYGIHVARLAGLPRTLLERARGLLAELESQRAHALPGERSPLDPQLALFGETESAERDRLAALAEALAELDLEAVTPLAALNLLADWRARFARPGPPSGEHL
jgi:DNA mismatch repair protein MutS